ncbi:Holliday junction resolvase RusA-like endonuclease [Bradyrhizobium elkanii]|uniref:RusA family crossover junction endodeoxyribonuclease n=1 Tax=Bradyrhizobium elkanii TaxID=29448 RepID=UPI0035129EB4
MTAITFTLPTPPSVNNLYVNSSRGRFRSQKYDEWIHEAGWEIKRQHPPRIKGPVKLSFEFEEPKTKRPRDLGNLEKATTDILVTHQIIEADDHSIVREIQLKWCAEVEGVRVTIEQSDIEVAT